jgi:hypothetical protein
MKYAGARSAWLFQGVTMEIEGNRGMREAITGRPQE